jgi:threonine dehydrogenase-like Zn-dependent dehydrogenase
VTPATWFGTIKAHASQDRFHRLRRLQYELGVVEQAPPGWLSASGEPLSPGDLVVPETRIPCHRCEYCRGVGSRPAKLLDYAHCPYQRGLGGIPLDEKPLLSGGWSDFVELPAGAIVHRIPEQICPDAAVLLEPFVQSIT